MSTEWSGKFTNVRFPSSDRKSRSAREVTVETDMRLGATVWLQEQEPVAYVVALLDGVRAFIPLGDYTQSRIYKGKKITFRTSEQEEKKEKKKLERRAHW